MGQALGVWTTNLAGLGLTWLVQSSVLMAAGLAAGRLLRRSGPAVQSAAYRTTLAAVLVCPAVSLILAQAGFDGLTFRLSAPTRAETPPPVAFAAMSPSVTPVERAPLVAPEPRAATTPVPAPITPRRAVPTRVPRPNLPLSAGTAAALGVLAWLAGSAALGLRLIVGQRQMGRIRASALEAEAEAEVLCRTLAARFRLTPPLVLRSPFLFSPCLDGLRRPAILLPDDLRDNLSATFLHELAHLARRDGLWNLLRCAANAVLWMQPLVWILSRRLEVTAEEVCDDYVVHLGADRADYAGHLLKLAERALPPTAPVGVGMISIRSLLGRRIVRILDPSRTLSTRAGTRAVFAALLVGLAGTMFAGLLGVGEPKRKALAQSPIAAKADPKQDTIRGQVVGPDETPFAGATVIAVRTRQAPARGIENRYHPDVTREITRTTSGADGRFEVTLDPLPRREPSDVSVYASAPGFGLGYYVKDQPIRLTTGEQAITGRLVDLEGRPVAGATIRMVMLQLPVTHTPRGADEPQGIGVDPAAVLPENIVTAPDGRFRIERLGRDAEAMLELSGANFAFKRVTVVTKRIPQAPGPERDPEIRDLFDRTRYGADCTIMVEPTRPIEGVVRDAETRAPIAGAIVTAFQLSGTKANIEGQIQTETDAQGRYRLVGLPKGNHHKLAVYPPLDQPYFITDQLDVNAGPGLEPVAFDIPLKRATWITGRLTDRKTGKPVRASVNYVPMLNNEHAREYVNFDPNVTSLLIPSRYRTDDDGRYRVVGLPGRGVVAVRCDDRGYRLGIGADGIAGRANNRELLTYDRIWPGQYHRLKEVDIETDARETRCDLTVDPGRSVKVHIVDPAGKPLTNVVVNGVHPANADVNVRHVEPQPQSATVARILALGAGETRMVVFRHEARKLGALLAVSADASKDEENELTVTLHPFATLSGRLVDSSGKPVQGGIQVRMQTESKPPRQLTIADVPLDAEGRFQLNDLPAGGSYDVRGTNRLVYGFGPKMKPEAFQPFVLASALKAEPGQAIELGTFNAQTGKRIAAPEAKTGPADVPITGRIVDLEGRPIAGASIKATYIRCMKKDDLTGWLAAVKKGDPPWIAARYLDFDSDVKTDHPQFATTTDQDGRFRLEGLGGERVVTLSLRGDTVAQTEIDAVTRRIAPIAAKGFPDTHGPGSQTVFGAEFTFTARPGRTIEGVVRDAKTRAPLPGVSVESWRFSGSDFVDTRSLKTVTDADGRFRLVGMPKGKGNQLIAVPNDDQPYFMHEASVGDPPGIGPIPLDIDLNRGIWIVGKVTDKITGKPAAEVRLHYFPFLDNNHVQALPEFPKGGSVHGFQTRYTTRSDGTYKLVGMPGHAIVGVESVARGVSYRSGVGSETIAGMDKNGYYKTWYNPIWPGRWYPNTLVEINPPPGVESVTVDAQLDPGETLRIRVVDAEGKPVPDAKVSGDNRLKAREKGDDAVFELTALRPDQLRTVVVRHDARNLGKVERLRAGDDAKGPVVVTLAPMAVIRGRTVDADGNPVPASQIRVDVAKSEGFVHQLATVTSDSEGRFEVTNVPSGSEYGLVAESGTMLKQRRVVFGKATVKPGETTDIGDLVFKRE